MIQSMAISYLLTVQEEHSMAAINKENLDERIERIKKRNEEIEKKYREAEEDRLMALKDNAMVETKPPKDEDWPKGHKYDKIDFTYDVKKEKLEELNQKQPEEVRSKRNYKKFADGEGPPPDPSYNFLADAERDGVTISKSDGKGERKDQRQNNKNKDPNNKRGGPGNNSFRGRGGKAHNPKYQKQNSQPEYEQWRSEREKIDEARINRQKVGDGKWRREWDNDKINNENEALLRPEKATLGDAMSAASKKSPTHAGKNNQHSGGHQQNQPNSPECVAQKRGNIIVSVTHTGKVKSVRLSSAPVIGTGRVGPRQPSKSQFSIQSVEDDVPLQHVPSSPRMQNKNHHKNMNNSHKGFVPPHHHDKGFNQTSNQKTPYHQKTPQSVNNVQSNLSSAANLVPSGLAGPPSPLKNKQKQPIVKQQLTSPANVIVPPDSPVLTANSEGAELPITSGNGIIPVDLSHKPEFAKKSVQERLLRVRQTPTVQQPEQQSGNQPTEEVKGEKQEIEVSPQNLKKEEQKPAEEQLAVEETKVESKEQPKVEENKVKPEEQAVDKATEIKPEEQAVDKATEVKPEEQPVVEEKEVKSSETKETPPESKPDPPIEVIGEIIENNEPNFEKASESLQAAEPIVACN